MLNADDLKLYVFSISSHHSVILATQQTMGLALFDKYECVNIFSCVVNTLTFITTLSRLPSYSTARLFSVDLLFCSSGSRQTAIIEILQHLSSRRTGDRRPAMAKQIWEYQVPQIERSVRVSQWWLPSPAVCVSLHPIKIRFVNSMYIVFWDDIAERCPRRTLHAAVRRVQFLVERTSTYHGSINPPFDNRRKAWSGHSNVNNRITIIAPNILASGLGWIFAVLRHYVRLNCTNRIILQTTCYIDDVVESHLCRLCVTLRSESLLGVSS